MGIETSEQRAGGKESDRRYDGGGQDTPLAQSEQARGNAEPAAKGEPVEQPTEWLTGRDGKPIPAKNDSGVAWAEAEDKA